MNILITGGTGFLGSHLINNLLYDGHRIFIIKRSFSNICRIKNTISRVISYNLDQFNIAQIFQEVKSIDVIIHMATCYGRHQENLKTLAQTNTIFPLELIETAIQFNVPLFLNTDTVLEKFLNPYSLSKKQFMEWGKYLANSKKIRFINIKLEHMYGHNDDDSKFTSYVVKSCMDNVAELDLTAGEQKRDFIYIDDVVSAYSLLLNTEKQKSEYFQEYEIGSGEAVSIREFVEMVHRLTKSTTKLNFGIVPYRSQEIMYSKANTTKLKKLNWIPRYNLEEGLSRTINLINCIK